MLADSGRPENRKYVSGECKTRAGHLRRAEAAEQDVQGERGPRCDAPEGWQKGFGVSVQTGLSGQGSSVSGSPAMGDEVLEESEFDPMFTDVEQALAGKKIALFGSYGWGDGQWMRDWEDRCREAGAVLAADSVIANDAPGDEETELCKGLGAALA